MAFKFQQLWALLCARYALAAMVTVNWSKNETDPILTTINTGDIVNWVWGDSFAHSVKSIDAKFTSSTIMQQMGYNYSIQFWSTGVHPYHCEVHSSLMTGIITVVTAAGEPTLSPTVFSTEEPDLSTAYSAPRVVKSGQALPATWTLRLEIRMTRVTINDYISYNTRSFCYLTVCDTIGPTLQLKAGDTVNLIVENNLGHNVNASDSRLKQPNTTRFYFHGLHLDPFLQFTTMLPGTRDTFVVEIPVDQPTGMHWYSSDMPGAAELHAMNGLVGAIYVEPQRIDNVPFAIQNAEPFVMVVTRLVVVQETDPTDGDITQGCSTSTVCDATFQAPLCTGSETTSPFNPYRLYTMEELNTEADSDLEVDMDFNGTTPKNLLLINGQHTPTVPIVNKNPNIFKIINAGTGKPLHITLPSSSVNCEGVVIAVDGVYLESRWVRTSIHIPAGSRVDLEVFCDFVGVYTIYESGEPFFHANIRQSSSNRPPVKDSQLETIRRPRYMDDLRVQNTSTIDRYFTVDMSLHPTSDCNYQIGYGMNCLNETVIYDENSTYPQYDYDCTYESWTGSQGEQPFDYLLANRFVTFENALNQWTIYGGLTGYQTFSMRVNHFQIIYVDSNETENDWFRVGQYRDTLPMVVGAIVIRFISADFIGEQTFQTDFVRHKERGAKQSYLVVNFSTFQSLTQFPTQAPTVTPDDGIIQTLRFEMAVGFGALVILGVVAIAIYLTFFTDSRNTVFPDKVM
mmetsp:Transcript_25818/g.43541  ORF Transcript_25818/g.43541 Transcript_25818/m.43541 type:complete len:739 (-) Transcript_25818:177-2393(-)